MKVTKKVAEMVNNGAFDRSLGVIPRATARRTIETELYQFSHGKLPRGRGWWVFENVATGEQVTVADELYSAAVRTLPSGTWKVLP